MSNHSQKIRHDFSLIIIFLEHEKHQNRVNRLASLGGYSSSPGSSCQKPRKLGDKVHVAWRHDAYR